ncbi:MAG TPA: FkbM family methyltransferase [Terriglobia bacterium]|nr:FkbM family methyltransferase [Terriglobia bacterium]
MVRAYTHCITMFYEVWSKRDYDLPGFAFGPSLTVIDVGANQGFFSLYAASKGAKVYAFEPCAENFEVLKWNVARNRLQDRVQAFNTAIAGASGQIVLYVGLDRSGEILSGSVSICNPERGGAGVQTRSVRAVTLDSVMNDLQIRKCDFLKMDCEGAEYDILRNTSAATFRKIARIAMECHGNRMGEAAAILRGAGFEILLAQSGITGILKAVNKSTPPTEPVTAHGEFGTVKEPGHMHSIP